MSAIPTPEQSLNDTLPDYLDMADIDAFSLDAITTSKKWNAQKIIIYGTPGTGKTSFAATFPNPILIRFEDGASALDIPTFPKVITNLFDFGKACTILTNGQHNFKTVIIDSLDWMEPVVWSYLLQREHKNSIEDWGYGKGYILLDDIWHNIINKLNLLKEKGINILAISHAQCVTFDPPDSDPYVTYSLKLHKRAAGIWTEWADSILFLDYKKQVSFGDNASKAGKAIGNGDRVIYTSSRPAYVAKSRWGLPQEILIGKDKSFLAFHKALAEASDGLYQNDLLTPDNSINLDNISQTSN